jgi:hypothetical protein
MTPATKMKCTLLAGVHFSSVGAVKETDCQNLIVELVFRQNIEKGETPVFIVG